MSNNTHMLTEKEIESLNEGDKLKVLRSYCLVYARDNDIVTYIDTYKSELDDFYYIQCKNKKGGIFTWSARRFALLGKEE